MMIIQLYLYLLTWCQAAETLTDQLTDLGKNVTINCDLDKNEFIWFLLKLPGLFVILHSFSNPDPFYYDKRFSHKYSVTSVDSNHHLFINNVTIDELGVYYCMSTDKNPQFSNGIRLHIIEPTPLSESQNHTVVQNQTVVKHIQQNQTPWQTLTLISALFNAILVIVVIGLLKVCAVRRSAEQQLHKTDVQPTHDLKQHQLQHAEEDTSMLYTNIHPGPVHCDYVKLQLPNNRHRHTTDLILGSGRSSTEQITETLVVQVYDVDDVCAV